MAKDAEGASSTSDAESFIHPNQILPILKKFVQEQIKPTKEKHRGSLIEGSGSSINRDSSQDAAYWDSMANVIDDHKLKMWDGLSESLSKYHSVLLERANRIRETDSLRQQNAELRMLLHQYISSKVNQELEIPPTRILQLEYS
uniref:Dynein regulatory complex protein 1-like n=1 Tax=Phallusia mammillata TaxID=59560 RepID=A0A6F9DG52_9ASCI|nr:dynein regulatory complex protein 1-like [Phallusia mammillata]